MALKSWKDVTRLFGPECNREKQPATRFESLPAALGFCAGTKIHYVCARHACRFCDCIFCPACHDKHGCARAPELRHYLTLDELAQQRGPTQLIAQFPRAPGAPPAAQTGRPAPGTPLPQAGPAWTLVPLPPLATPVYKRQPKAATLEGSYGEAARSQ